MTGHGRSSPALPDETAGMYRELGFGTRLASATARR